MDAGTGATTGAATGAAIGSVVPGVGTAIGGVAGGLTGLIGGLWSESNTRKAKRNAINQAIKTLENTEGYADQMLANGSDILSDQLSSANGLFGSTEDVAAALKAAQDKVNALSPYEASEFNYGKSIEDFYDPAFQLSVNTANDAINSSQALGGNLFSSDTANKIAAQNQVLASQMYRDALSAYNTDKGLEQSIWQGNENAKQAAVNSASNLANMQYGMASDSASNLSATNNSYYQNLLNLSNSYWGDKSDYWANIANLQAQKY